MAKEMYSWNRQNLNQLIPFVYGKSTVEISNLEPPPGRQLLLNATVGYRPGKREYAMVIPAGITTANHLRWWLQGAENPHWIGCTLKLSNLTPESWATESTLSTLFAMHQINNAESGNRELSPFRLNVVNGAFEAVVAREFNRGAPVIVKRKPMGKLDFEWFTLIMQYRAAHEGGLVRCWKGTYNNPDKYYFQYKGDTFSGKQNTNSQSFLYPLIGVYHPGWKNFVPAADGFLTVNIGAITISNHECNFMDVYNSITKEDINGLTENLADLNPDYDFADDLDVNPPLLF